MKKKQLYGRGVPMLCIACQLTVAPLFFSSRVQAVPGRSDPPDDRTNTRDEDNQRDCQRCQQPAIARSDHPD